jgi:hypothetical protein
MSQTPSKDHIRYDLLAQEALRGVVKRVLQDVIKFGLPGEHHFYIAFSTTYPGVRVSARLREQYPDDMTIVLQHQFWDLGVTEHTFEVGLSFGGVPERLLVPFDAVKGFFDPSVQFGLQFEPVDPDQKSQRSAPQATHKPEGKLRPAGQPRGAGSEPGEAMPKSSSIPKIGKSKAPTAPIASDVPTPPERPVDEPQKAGAEVVSLDKFRKK